MNVVTSVPSELAVATDLVDRDIYGHISIGQEALFPLPAIPSSLTIQSAGVPFGNWRSSFLTDQGAAVANGAQLVQTMAILNRGLWTLRGTYNYLSNYIGNVGTIECALKLVDPNAQVVSLVALNAGNRQTDGRYEYTFLLKADGYTLQTLLTANGVGQAHGFVFSCAGSKYL